MKRYIFIISLLFFCLFASAQQKSVVRGIVKDASGQPVSGAVVMVEGQASIGTMTDDKGAYVLDLKSSDLKKVVLNVSCISYKTVVEALNGRSVVDFVLVDDSKLLDEVVVVGYGAMKRSDLTGSVASVRIEEDMAARSTSIDQLLQGRAAGVQVLSNSAAPDAGVTIRIRGLGSFNDTIKDIFLLKAKHGYRDNNNDIQITVNHKMLVDADNLPDLIGINSNN